MAAQGWKQKGLEGLDWQGDHRMLDYSNRAPGMFDATLDMAQMLQREGREGRSPLFSLWG